MFWLRFITALAVAVFCLTANDAIAQGNVPKIWDRHEFDQIDVPVASPAYSQKVVSPDYYYRIPVSTDFKWSYPVYAPGRAPAGYMEKLKRLATGTRL